MGLINEAYQTPFSRYPATAISRSRTVHNRRIRHKRAVFVRRVRAKAVFDIVLDASIGVIGMLAAIDTCLIIVCRFALIVIGRWSVFCGGFFFGAGSHEADASERADNTDDTADNFRDVFHNFSPIDLTICYSALVV